MAVIRVLRSQDRAWRIEFVEDRGRVRYRLLSRSACVAECDSIEELGGELAERGLSVDDLIED